jgi:hypothetical protein
MKRYLNLFVYLTAIFAGAALAHATDQPDNSAASTSPVAYVYVSESTGIEAFAAASDGKLTPVPGSPFGGVAIGHISENSKYLFGLGADGIYSYAIAADGTLTQVAVTSPPANDPGECPFMGYTLQIDHTGKSLYSFDPDCDNLPGNDQYIRSFKIEDNGALQFLANTDSGSANEEGNLSPAVFLGTDKYAYQTG